MSDTTLEKIILDTIDIPSLPPIARKVMQLAYRDLTTLNELERIIAMDQAFSTRLLKIANSPYFARSRTIENIPTAIMIIGFDNMKNFVIATSLNDIHRKHGIMEQKLWEHSLGVSLAASMLATEAGMVCPEEALVAGLIHDVGKTILNNSIPAQYSLVAKKVREEEISFIEAENTIIGFSHCSVGGLIARKWQLPNKLETVIEHHHSATLQGIEGNHVRLLCQTISLADAMCLNMGIGLTKAVKAKQVYPVISRLTGQRLSELEEEFQNRFNEQKHELLD